MRRCRECVSPVSGFHQPGFTLVELQIALLLLSLITVIMISTFRLSSKTWEKVVHRQNIAEHQILVVQVLRRQISNMQSLRVRTPDGEWVRSFFGDKNQMHFVAPYPTFRHNNDLYWWSLESSWNEEKNINELWLKYRPFKTDQIVSFTSDGSLLLEGAYLGEDGDTQQYEELQETEILVASNLEIESLEYFARDELGYPMRIDQWNPTDQVPQLVILQLRAFDDSDREKPWQQIAAVPGYVRQQLGGATDG